MQETHFFAGKAESCPQALVLVVVFTTAWPRLRSVSLGFLRPQENLEKGQMSICWQRDQRPKISKNWKGTSSLKVMKDIMETYVTRVAYNLWSCWSNVTLLHCPSFHQIPVGTTFTLIWDFAISGPVHQLTDTKWKPVETIIPQAPRAPRPAFLTNSLSGCLRQCPWASAWAVEVEAVEAVALQDQQAIELSQSSLSLLYTFVYFCSYLAEISRKVQVSVHQMLLILLLNFLRCIQPLSFLYLLVLFVCLSKCVGERDRLVVELLSM